MPSGALPQVVIAGLAQAGKASLVSKLCPAKTPADRAVWHFSTKYYEASAEVVAVTLHEGGSAVLGPSEAGRAEALVLLFDCTRQASFLAVKDWAAGPGRSLSDSCDVCLCIANKVDLLRPNGATFMAENITRPAWHTEAAEWCSSCMFEYIEASVCNAEVDERLRTDGERQGVARIVAALHAHTWTGLRMHAQPISRAQPAQTDPTDAAASPAAPAAPGFSYDSFTDTAASPEVGLEASDPAGLQHTSYVPPAVAAESLTSSLDHPSREYDPGRPQQRPHQTPGLEHMMDPSNGIMEGVDPAHTSDAEVERDSARMETLFSQLAVARDRVQTLPNEQRREAAAAMAHQLMQHFSLDDSGPEDVDSDEID